MANGAPVFFLWNQLDVDLPDMPKISFQPNETTVSVKSSAHGNNIMKSKVATPETTTSKPEAVDSSANERRGSNRSTSQLKSNSAEIGDSSPMLDICKLETQISYLTLISHALADLTASFQISSESNNADNIELMYDPILKCYYDPATNKYYELQNEV